MVSTEYRDKWLKVTIDGYLSNYKKLHTEIIDLGVTLYIHLIWEDT